MPNRPGGDYDYDELHLQTQAEAEETEEAQDDHCDGDVESTATEMAVADLNSDPR